MAFRPPHTETSGVALGFDDDLATLLAAGGSAAALPRARPAPDARKHGLRRALLTADVLGLLLSLVVVQLMVTGVEPGDGPIDLIALGGVALWIVVSHVGGLYEQATLRLGGSAGDDLVGLVLLTSVATLLGMVALDATGLAYPPPRTAGVFWVLAICLMLALRLAARRVVARSAEGRQATLIVGTGEVARRAARTLRIRPQRGLDVVGFVDDEPLPLGPDDPPCLGGADHIEELVRAYGIQRVIVAFSPLPVPAQVELFRRCMDLGVHVDIVPRMFEVTGARSRMHHLDGLPLVGFRPPRLSASARIGKRVLDVVLASVGLVALWPLFAYVAVRIRLESAGPVLFWQERMGAGGRPFRIVKFRSMSVDAERRKAEVRHLNCHTEPGPRMFKVPDDPRVTPFGRWLRSTSLDELPQLWNVLRGEMSLVGPRPLILEEDCQVMRHGRRRLDLTPGVTGLWQITGRSDVGLAEMLTLDYLYVTDWSLWGDLKILARTIPVVLRRSGAY